MEKMEEPGLLTMLGEHYYNMYLGKRKLVGLSGFLHTTCVHIYLPICWASQPAMCNPNSNCIGCPKTNYFIKKTINSYRKGKL